METVRLIDMVAPDGFGQYGLVNDMVRSVGKIEQDVVFFLEKFQFLVVNEYLRCRLSTLLIRAFSSARWKGFGR